MQNFCCPWQTIGLKVAHHAIGNTELIWSGTNDILLSLPGDSALYIFHFLPLQMRQEPLKKGGRQM